MADLTPVLTELQARLHGAWRLTAYEDRESINDDWKQMYGAEPLGLAIYDPTGVPFHPGVRGGRQPV